MSFFIFLVFGSDSSVNVMSAFLDHDLLGIQLNYETSSYPQNEMESSFYDISTIDHFVYNL